MSVDCDCSETKSCANVDCDCSETDCSLYVD